MCAFVKNAINIRSVFFFCVSLVQKRKKEILTYWWINLDSLLFIIKYNNSNKKMSASGLLLSVWCVNCFIFYYLNKKFQRVLFQFFLLHQWRVLYLSNECTNGLYYNIDDTLFLYFIVCVTCAEDVQNTQRAHTYSFVV